MSSDRFVLAIIARTIYEEELAKKLGINPHLAYGRKKLNEYLFEFFQRIFTMAIISPFQKFL